MIRIEHPGPTVRQVMGHDQQGQYILSVLHRVTYQRQPDGRLIRAAEQVPLRELPEEAEPRHLLQEIDLFPAKPMTDLVILGQAYGHGRSQFEATIIVNPHSAPSRKLSIAVIGDRECADLGGGQIYFSPPSPVHSIPLDYRFAYGGTDTIAMEQSEHFWVTQPQRMNLDDASKSVLNPFCYPRNPVGKGYLLEPSTDAINRLQLPNLEDPTDRLTPGRICVRDPGRWHTMPLPHATGWNHYSWFPRMGYLGLHPGMSEEPKVLEEVRREYCPLHIHLLRKPDVADCFRWTCGAPPALQFPHFRGGESVTLENLHPRESRVTFALPEAGPRIWIDGRKGTLKRTDPVIQSVIIEPDQDRVSVVWRGCERALRPYLPEELKSMPLRVEWD
jgi:hypothetical protein